MNWFNNMKFRNKFFLAFGILLSFVIMLAVIGIITIKNVESAFFRLTEGPNKRLVYASDAVSGFSVCRRNVLAIAYVTGDSEYVKACYEKYKSSTELIVYYLDAYYDNFISDTSLQDAEKESREIIITGVKNKFCGPYQQNVEELYVASIANDKERISELLAEGSVLGEEISDSLWMLRAIVQEHVDKITDETHAYAYSSITILIAFAVFIIILSLVVSILMSSILRKPLDKMKESMAEITKGNLLYPIRSDNKDELGLLSNQIGDMVDTISLLNKAVAIVDNVDEMIFVTDLNYRLIFVNRKVEEIFGIDRDACIGHKCYSFIFGDIDKPCSFCPLAELLPEKDSFPSYDWENRLNINGKDIWFACKTSIIRWVDGSSVQIITYKDETLRKSHDEELLKVAEAAKEASRAKSIFLAKMSHEIRTPMNAVMGMSELILRANLPQDVLENAHAIKTASQNLLSIINDILDLSKIESGKLEIVETEYLLKSLINDVISIVRIKLIEKPISFIVNIDPHIPASLIGDEVRIRQTLLNLLGNAVKYTQSGFISMTATGVIENDTATLTIDIADSGMGIREEDMADLFGEFVQIDLEKNKDIEGTGLGLPISLKLVNAMGGNITVRSEYEKGSTFTVRLPQKFREYKPFASVDNYEDKFVLLYVSEPMHRASISQTLSDLGVKFNVAGSISDLTENPEKYSHMFIDSSANTLMFDCIAPALRKLNNPPRLVILYDITEAPSRKKSDVIILPAYSLPVSNILNGVDEERDSMTSESESFKAPSIKVLIVDDMLSNLMVAKGLLSPYEMNITTCTSGEEAIRLIANNRYDLVFMDHMMPKMDGIEATSLIRAMEGEYFSNLPIIALTANAIAGAKEMFIEHSMNDFLAKPIETTKLNAILEKWIPEDKRSYGNKDEEDEAQADESDFLKAIKSINGLSADKAVSTMGGSVETYESIVKLSVRLLPENIERLEEFLKGGRDEDYAIEIHGVKGVLNNIGAYEVGKLAYNLEELAKSGDMDKCRQIHPDFIEKLSEFMKNVTNAVDITERAEKQEGDASQILSILPGLEEAVEFFNASNALEILSSIHRYTFGMEFDSLITDVRRAFEDFDFDWAEEALKKLRGAFETNG